MKLSVIDHRRLPRVRAALLRFMKRYGEGRITYKALRWFRDLPVQQWDEGTWVAVATVNKKLVGVIVFGGYGLDEALITVHPDYRKQRVAEKLLDEALANLGKVYTRVACDNTASLKLCFTCGLQAFQLFRGPTGKATLWLGGGEWDVAEVEERTSFAWVR
ncbi:GNAT family N-acetyltransferase [Mechercharimyces sp. CAU 1602]|uniref:GNAT family N-acetyltransferase n=1 Tax=Mechercharimyces sp. CAU 1602 TaxID=2973933 RepID=UPI0021630844|nr:GNAT family N-acetyltransferase [Mechercharimyces sp. CAU 1602]MCS1352473.1 GNAT family N-acetyltransferase [Mechercharimyces sp. CAU 1602]